MKISVNNLNKSFGNKIVFKDFNLDRNDEKINCIVGQSGCGKSTFLNIISGLTDIDGGEVVGINNGDISYVFQEDRLIEYLTIYENLELTLKSYYKKHELKDQIDELLNLLGLEEVKNKYPSALSGGMKQRVNIARAFGKPSKIILMDEAFKSLDYKLKYIIIDEFKNILKNRKRMVIVVTHDLDEAIYFQGNIFVFGGEPALVKGKFDANIIENKENIINLM